MPSMDARRLSTVLAILLLCGTCAAQTTTQNSPATPLPDAPQSSSPAPAQSAIPADELQTKRVMGIMPNFRSVSPGEKVPEPTVRQKFITASEDNFDYSALIFYGLIAANSFLTKQTPEFHQGAAGYARYYWHSLADQCVENYFVEFIIPTFNHEDARYYAMGRQGGGIARRSFYALSRTFVTRSDTGKPMFNFAEIAGSGLAAGTSSFYYPTREQTVSNGLRNWGLDVTYDALTFLFHEFWPDISYALFGKRSATPTPIH